MLYAALLNTTIFHGMAFYIANTLLVFAVLMRCCNSLFRLVENRNKLNLVDLFYVLLGPFLLWHITNSYFTGYSPDFFISILQIILSCELIALFTCPGASQPEQNSTITRIMLLGGLSITVKLSGIVFTIGILISALLFYFFNASPSSHKIKSFLNWMGLLALFVIPWVTRSIILSGYPFFPSPFLSFNVPWKIPKEVVNPISHIVYTWAKYGSNNPTDIPFSEWIGTWLKRIPFEIKECFIFMIILLFFIALLHLFGHHNKRQSESLRVFWIITVVSFASLVFWYLMAPDPRFIGMTIWLVMNSILVILVLQLMDLRIFNSLNLLAAIVIILELLWLAPRFTKQISRSFIISSKLETTIAEQNVSKIPQPFQITASGLKVYLPKDASKEACWDAPLPCTRANDFFLGLSLIDPNNMQKGFYTLPSTYN